MAKFADFMGTVVFKGVASGGTPEQLQAYNDGVSHSQLLSLIQTIVILFVAFVSTYIIKWIGLMGTWIVDATFGTVGFILFSITTNKWFYILNISFIGIGLAIVGVIPYVLLSIHASPEIMAGVQAVMLLCANIAAVFAQFAVTMGLGAIEIFVKNSGYLISVCSIFFAVNTVCGALGIHLKEKQIISIEEVDNNDPVASQVDNL